ncbi:MAG: DUF4279 domain-containing protein [Candidatus Melainabacteria bacterium]|jgi:hypothetical protein
MKNRTTVSLRITDLHFTPEELTKLLGIQPTRAFKKGSKIDKLSIEHKFNGWILSSGISEEESFCDHIQSLVTIIESRIDLFTLVCNQYSSVISSSITINKEYQESLPSIHLDERAMKVFTQIGAEFDLDLYII